MLHVGVAAHPPDMTTIGDIVRELGGLATKQQLVMRGAHDRHLTAAVKSRDVERVRNGWYSTWSTSDPRLRAVRVGGRLTGRSAIAQMGGWVSHRGGTLHVAVETNGGRLRLQGNRRRRRTATTRDGVQLHWEPRDARGRGEQHTVALEDALVRMALDEPFEDAVAAFDWALHTNRIEMFDVHRIVQRLPARLQCIPEWVDARCESYPESIARTRARFAGFRVRTQVPVGTRPVDVLVEETVVLEVDGEQFHVATFESDRDKDLDISVAGKHCIRPTAKHVLEDWPRVELAVRTALERRGIRPVGNSGLSPRRAAELRATPPRRSHRRPRIPEFPTSTPGMPTGRGRLSPA